MMLFKLLCLLVIFNMCICDDSEYDYTDAVIDMLLNGASPEFTQLYEVVDGKEPVLSAGVWKCGNCDDLDKSKLVYSEVNEVDDNMLTDTSVIIEIAFTMPGMQCITIHSDTPGVVRRVAGACTGGSLTLNVAAAAHFTVNIYN